MRDKLADNPHSWADSLARRAWKALQEGRGMRLSAYEVMTLHEIQGDGEWWQSFNPAAPSSILSEPYETSGWSEVVEDEGQP